MHDDPDVGRAACRLGGIEPLTQGGQRACPLLVVGGIHVDVQRLDALGLDGGDDLGDMRVGRPEIEVDPADVVAGPGERPGRRLAHPGRAAEDQRPALAVVGHSGASRGRCRGGGEVARV